MSQSEKGSRVSFSHSSFQGTRSCPFESESRKKSFFSWGKMRAGILSWRGKSRLNSSSVKHSFSSGLPQRCAYSSKSSLNFSGSVTIWDYYPSNGPGEQPPFPGFLSWPGCFFCSLFLCNCYPFSHTQNSDTLCW